jgi:predicted glycoside hydrolase/deacetylase ChbG (UPF0249 family)
MPTPPTRSPADRADTAQTGLVLCADDYSVHAPASAGILDLARRQRLSATSVMVLSPRWPADAAPLREVRDQVDVGLHLDFTSPMACAAGHGRSLGALMLRCTWPLDTALQQQWRTAIERQCDAFEQHWQQAPDHLDGHQHVQQFAGLRELLLAVLTRRYDKRPWLRVSRVAQSGLKPAIIRLWGAGPWQQQLQAAGWLGVGPLRGAYGFDGGEQAYAQRMRQWLQAARADGGLVMCHPAQQVVSDDPIGAARAWEYAYLSSNAFAHDLQAAGVRLVRGSALHS